MDLRFVNATKCNIPISLQVPLKGTRRKNQCVLQRYIPNEGTQKTCFRLSWIGFETMVMNRFRLIPSPCITRRRLLTFPATFILPSMEIYSIASLFSKRSFSFILITQKKCVLGLISLTLDYDQLNLPIQLREYSRNVEKFLIQVLTLALNSSVRVFIRTLT